MKIFQAFLMLVVVAILWMLPVTQAIYDFRTDLREDDFNITTSPAETDASVVLFTEVYQGDNQTISLSSNLAADSPVLDAYTEATRLVEVSGLSSNATRVLTVSYLYDALSVHKAINTVMNILPIIWILVLVAFPAVALVAIWRS